MAGGKNSKKKDSSDVGLKCPEEKCQKKFTSLTEFHEHTNKCRPQVVKVPPEERKKNKPPASSKPPKGNQFQTFKKGG